MDIPAEILVCIVEFVSGRRDLCSICLASRTLNAITTPCLYHTLDSRTISRNHTTTLFHPSSTLLRKPYLAKYVRHITEIGAVHALPPPTSASILASLRLCTSATSFTWIDNDEAPFQVILNIIDILLTLPIRSLAFRTRGDLGQHAWQRISEFKNITSVAVWSMEGQPRVLQGWAEHLSNLTHLELGRCAGVPPSILISIFSYLTSLTFLLLKGVNSSSIPSILALLPSLQSLDTDFLPASISRPPSTVSPLPRLSHLTIRTGSVDLLGPQDLWWWITHLVPHPNTLTSFTLNAFSVQGATHVRRGFIMDLAKTHANTLRQFVVGVAQMSLLDLGGLCHHCTHIEEIVCGVASPDVSSIARAISSARNLRILKLHVQWIPQSSSSLSHLIDDDNDYCYSNSLSVSDPSRQCAHYCPPCNYPSAAVHLPTSHPSTDAAFTDEDDPATPSWPRFDTLLASDGPVLSQSTLYRLYSPDNRFQSPYSPSSQPSMAACPFMFSDACALMLRPGSVLRTVGMGGDVYTGRWVLKNDHTPVDSASIQSNAQHKTHVEGGVGFDELDRRDIVLEVVKDFAHE